MTTPTARVVLISGAAGGIGALLVERFLADGDTVIATDSSTKALDAMAADRSSDRLLTFTADITDEDQTQALADFARRHTGRVDVLVNCAGWFPIVAFESMTPQQWRTVIDVNLTGPFLVTQAILPLMRDRERGRIINFGSGSVFDGTRGQSHYVAAKAGVVGFSRSLARELGDYGITVNVVAPGLTVTPAVREGFPAAVLAAQRDARALHRDEEPADLVGVVAFLASTDGRARRPARVGAQSAPRRRAPLVGAGPATGRRHRIVVGWLRQWSSRQRRAGRRGARAHGPPPRRRQARDRTDFRDPYRHRGCAGPMRERSEICPGAGQ